MWDLVSCIINEEIVCFKDYKFYIRVSFLPSLIAYPAGKVQIFASLAEYPAGGAYPAGRE